MTVQPLPQPLPLPLEPVDAPAEGSPRPAERDLERFPPLRLLPAPSCEPPLEALPAPAAPTARTLDPRLVPAWPAPTPGPRPPACDETLEEELRDLARRRTPAGALPPAGRVARALVQRIVEAGAGVRSPQSLQRDVTLEVLDLIELGCPTRVPAAGRARPSAGAVRSVHAQVRPEGVADVCATVDDPREPGRRVAVALRLEGHDGAWRCTRLQGWPVPPRPRVSR